MRSICLLAATLLVAPFGSAVAQVRISPMPKLFATQDPDRAMLGVSTRSSGRRDTLGLLVESVTRGGPAEKAGIEEGDRLVSVGTVNLRLSPDDAGEPDMEGIASRRLVRELGRHKAGDEVELRVYRDGQSRNVRARLMSADELNEGLRGSFTVRGVSSDRAVLGISLGGSGSRRDTAGVLVVGVTSDGPAAKAGLEEGDRITAINGVDLRVAREDAGDWQASSARIRRLNREMEKVKAGDVVELRIVSNGQARTIRVTTSRAGDLPRQSGAYYFGDGLGGAIERMGVSPSVIRVDPRRITEEVQRRMREVETARRAAETLRQELGATRARIQRAVTTVDSPQGIA